MPVDLVALSRKQRKGEIYISRDFKIYMAWEESMCERAGNSLKATNLQLAKGHGNKCFWPYVYYINPQICKIAASIGKRTNFSRKWVLLINSSTPRSTAFKLCCEQELIFRGTLWTTGNMSSITSRQNMFDLLQKLHLLQPFIQKTWNPKAFYEGRLGAWP